MEVDPTPTSGVSLSATTNSIASLQLNPLKRSNSAPMINALVSTAISTATVTVPTITVVSCTMTDISTSTLTASNHGSMSPVGRQNERIRRFSCSSLALHSPTTPVKTPNRLDQLRQEEIVPRGEAERAHERKVHSDIELSKSMEDICAGLHEEPEPKPRPTGFDKPLHINTSSAIFAPGVTVYGSSPSPTRIGRQCFSPSLQQPVTRHFPNTPSPSPSPTRKTFRRSISPISASYPLRPSPLGSGIKRKMELSEDRGEMHYSPSKRFQSSMSPLGGATPERPIAISHPLLHRHLPHTSVSSSSLEDGSSPEQRVPAIAMATLPSLTASTPKTCSPSVSCFSFRPVRDSVDSHCTNTDSETSDMTEISTDISEATDSCSFSHTSELMDSQTGTTTMVTLPSAMDTGRGGGISMVIASPQMHDGSMQTQPLPGRERTPTGIGSLLTTSGLLGSQSVVQMSQPRTLGGLGHVTSASSLTQMMQPPQLLMQSSVSSPAGAFIRPPHHPHNQTLASIVSQHSLMSTGAMATSAPTFTVAPTLPLHPPQPLVPAQSDSQHQPMDTGTPQTTAPTHL